MSYRKMTIARVSEGVNGPHGEQWEDGILLPTQMAYRRNRATGERALLAAVLDDAIHCCRGRGMQTTQTQAAVGRVRDEAWGWIKSEDRSHLCTFVRICEEIGCDPGQVRAKILDQEEKMLAITLASRRGIS